MDREKVLAERAAAMEKVDALVKLSETREWTPEETAQVEALKSQVNDLNTRVAALEAEGSDSMETDSAKPPAEGEMKSKPRSPEFITRAEQTAAFLRSQRQTPHPVGFVRDLNDRKAQRSAALAFQGWLRGADASDEQRQAMADCGIRNSERLTLPSKEEAETRAAQTITTTGGGHAIATGFVQKFEERLLYYCPIRQYADILTTAEGNPLNFPTVDDTSISAADRTINTATSEDAFTLGQVSLSSYGKSTELLVPYELFMDATLSNFESRLADLLAERHGRKEQTDFTTGSGSSAPQGMVTGAGTGKTTASATAIAADEILDLEASLDPAYRQGAVFFMHSSVWTYIRKLKDSQGRYLVGDWNALGQGTGYSLLGYPVIFNNAMASSVATTNKTVLFCQPKKFMIRQAGARELIRDTSRFVREDQILIKLRQRYDSRVVQANAFKLLVQA